jgi:ElaB/YqjD/DUF883 family membrane-anchored ribosome-binding protein
MLMRTETAQSAERAGNGASRQDSKGATDTDISAIEREFQNLVADIEDLIQANTSLSGDDLVRARIGLHARVAAAKESVQRLGPPLIDRARDAVKDTASRVRAQPWQAIGVAAGASLLVGYLVGRVDRRQGS